MNVRYFGVLVQHVSLTGAQFSSRYKFVCQQIITPRYNSPKWACQGFEITFSYTHDTQ